MLHPTDTVQMGINEEAVGPPFRIRSVSLALLHIISSVSFRMPTASKGRSGDIGALHAGRYIVAVDSMNEWSKDRRWPICSRGRRPRRSTSLVL